MKKLLVTRSKHDPGNNCMYAYSEEIIEEAQGYGWTVTKAEDENNNAEEVQSRLSKANINLVLFHGHGTEDSIHGHKDKVLIDVASAKLLANTIVYASACYTASLLGDEAKRQGCKAFIGYDGFFTIPQVNEYLGIPLRDPTARPVLEASNTVSRILIKGSTVEAAVKASKSKAYKIIQKMLWSKEPYDNAALSALIDNNFNLTFKGDAQASIK